MPFKTKHFNKNQVVWVQLTTGMMAKKVIGKFRGKNRYVSAWVNYGNTTIPQIDKIEVDSAFAERHNLERNL